MLGSLCSVAPVGPLPGGRVGRDGAMRAIALGSLLALIGMGPGPAAHAEGLTLSGSGASRLAIFERQKDLLDGRLAKQYSGSERLKPKREGEEDGPLPAFRGNYKGEFLEVAKAAARKHNIPEDLFLRLVQQESGWNVAAVSPKGATGLAQLMPDTARLLRVDIHDPVQNLEGGARYLRMMYERFGSWRLALAAYNAGPGAVDEHGGIPPYAETENYVKAILG